MNSCLQGINKMMRKEYPQLQTQKLNLTLGPQEVSNDLRAFKFRTIFFFLGIYSFKDYQQHNLFFLFYHRTHYKIEYLAFRVRAWREDSVFIIVILNALSVFCKLNLFIFLYRHVVIFCNNKRYSISLQFSTLVKHYGLVSTNQGFVVLRSNPCA